MPGVDCERKDERRHEEDEDRNEEADDHVDEKGNGDEDENEGTDEDALRAPATKSRTREAALGRGESSKVVRGGGRMTAGRREG